MSEVIAVNTGSNICVELILTTSESYVETLKISCIDAQPGLLELVVRTQFLGAKNPSEKRVKSRTCIERARLVELQHGIGQFLQATASSPGELVLS